MKERGVVEDEEWRTTDNRRAGLIYLLSAIAASIVTGLLYFL